MKSIKKRSKSRAKYTPSTILSIGHYDIDYSITLSEEDALKYHIEDITQLNTVEDISFLIENQYLWDRIKLKTDNNTINLLLYLNKISYDINKSYIEYIAFEKPIYYNDSVKLMLKTVNDLNFFFVNNYPLNPGTKKYFSLTIKYKDKERVIKFDKNESDEKNNNADNEVQNEGSTNDVQKEEKVEKEEITENNNKNENYLNNKENPFNKIKLDCAKYNYFICSIEDSLLIDPFEDFIEFVIYVKIKYGALITIEYSDVSEYFTDKDSMTLLNKLYLVTDIFLFDEKDTINNFKQHYEIVTKENSKKKYFSDKVSEEGTEIYNHNYNEDDKSQVSIKLYLNQNISLRKKKEMTEKDLYEYFRRTIACNGTLSILNSKLGIFLDNNFSKVTFIEVPLNIKATTLSYDIKPFPKLTHTTVDLVELYKGTLRIRRGFF